MSVKVALNSRVSYNFKIITWQHLVLPFLVFQLFIMYFGFISNDLSFEEEYIALQSDWFYTINNALSKFPITEFNLTQMGDVYIVFPLFTIFLIYAPKFWNVLILSSLISLLASAFFKNLFHIPRPAAVLDLNKMVIIGDTLKGNNSLPSGHSITTIVVLTTLLFAFMPKKKFQKVIWSSFILLLGLIVVSSRIAVGAHYPLDVFIGSVLGYSIAVFGILISNTFENFKTIHLKKFYPILIVSFVIWIGIIVNKIKIDSLAIYYFSIISLLITAFLMTRIYVQKKN